MVCNPAMSISTPALSGPEPIAPRGCRSKSRLRIASKTSSAALSSTRCQRAISLPSLRSTICPPDKKYFIGSAFRTFLLQRSSASRWSASFVPGRATSDRSRSSGQVIKRARGGGSTRHAVACVLTLLCSETGRIFSSIPAITSTPISRFSLRSSCQMVKSGRTCWSKKRRSPRRPSRNSAVIGNTIFWIRTCLRSMPRFPRSRNGTTTKSWTTGGPASH